MAYLTIVSQLEHNWAALTPELHCIGTAKTREALIAQAREAIALALEDAPGRATVTTLEQLDPEVRAEIGPDDEVLFLEPAPMNPVSREIAARLRELGLTQNELARRLGTSHSAVSRMVNPFYWGHSMELLRRTAEALDAELRVTLRAG